MCAQAKSGKRSPLKRKPLRNAGDSVQDELFDRVFGDGFATVMAAIVLAVVAVFEWLHALTGLQPQPYPLTLAAIAVGAYGLVRFRRVLRDSERLRLGRDGERTVAQHLEVNRSPDWRLFNDLAGDGFNVDHVLVTPHGVFVLETKTRSMPAVGRATVVYNGETVAVDGGKPDPHPIAQVRANRDWVRDLLRDTTGRSVPVKGIVVYPGWWVEEKKGHPRSDVWVLNMKAVTQWIANEPTLLKDEDVALLSDALVYRITRE